MTIFSIKREKDLCCTGRGSNNATDTRLKLSVHDRTFQTELSDMTLERNKQEQKVSCYDSLNI